MQRVDNAVGGRLQPEGEVDRPGPVDPNPDEVSEPERERGRQVQQAALGRRRDRSGGNQRRYDYEPFARADEVVADLASARSQASSPPSEIRRIKSLSDRKFTTEPTCATPDKPRCSEQEGSGKRRVEGTDAARRPAPAKCGRDRDENDQLSWALDLDAGCPRSEHGHKHEEEALASHEPTDGHDQ